MRTRATSRLVAALFVLALLAAACGDDGESATSADTSISTTTLADTTTTTVTTTTLIDPSTSDDQGSADPAPTVDDAGADVVIALEVVDGDVVGGSRQETVSLGDSVRVEVTGNSDDQVHVHGYDLYVDLADGAGSTTFDALIPGTFEIELEGSARLLVRMTVS